MYAARLAYTGASPHRKSVCVRSFTNGSILEHELHGLRRSLPCLPKKNGKSPKEENAAPSLRPENFAGHYPPRNSLPSVAQTGAPADATGEIFSLRAPASVPMGGELDQCWTCIGHRVRDSFSPRTFFSYTSAGPHRDGCHSLHARGSFVSRASTLPCADVRSHAGADPHTLINFLRRRGRYGRKKFSRSCVSACKKQGMRPAFRDSCEFI